ncbi:hypothetical protein AB0F77_14555 [Streptomyces sp. NPDC026672]|uniref:hypothetical protein n=1 Tax=unclassified Streptomyces TaxID=2593676 RepID=UPI0034118343
MVTTPRNTVTIPSSGVGPRPGSGRHPLRAEVLRGPGPWAGGAVLVVVGGVLAGSPASWQGDWAETVGRLHSAQLVALPLAAAAGCWQGGRERRHRTEEVLASAVRSPLARFLASALPVALWTAAGHLAVVALALLATWPWAPGGGPRLASVPADTVALVAAVLVGHAVGRAVPSRLAAPLVAIAGYLALSLPIYANGGPAAALDPAFAPGGGDAVPVWWQPAVLAVWTAGLAGAAVLACAAQRRATALLPLAAAAAAGALLVQTGDGLWRTDPPARRQVCDTSVAPAVCVNARHPGLLPQVGEALSGVTGKLEGVRNLPVRWEDRLGEPRRDEVQLPMLTPVGWSVVRGRLTDPRRYAWEAAMALTRGAECDDPRLRVAGDAVLHHLAPHPKEAYFDGLDARGTAERRHDLERRLAARARLESLGEEERRDWLSAYFGAVARCDPAGLPVL